MNLSGTKVTANVVAGRDEAGAVASRCVYHGPSRGLWFLECGARQGWTQTTGEDRRGGAHMSTHANGTQQTYEEIWAGMEEVCSRLMPPIRAGYAPATGTREAPAPGVRRPLSPNRATAARRHPSAQARRRTAARRGPASHTTT